jgi:hypothetical protein
VVPVDVGKYTAMAMVADGDGQRLIAPFTFRWTVPACSSWSHG